MKLPNRFTDASILDWKVNDPARVTITKYLVNITSYTERGVAPVFMGPTGRGKSRAAAATLNAIKQHSIGDVEMLWFSTADALNMLADFKDSRANEMYYPLMTSLMETELIVLDDVTALRDAPRLREYLWMILNHRYEELKPTILTINTSCATNIDALKELTRWADQSIARRIRDCSEDLLLLM